PFDLTSSSMSATHSATTRSRTGGLATYSARVECMGVLSRFPGTAGKGPLISEFDAVAPTAARDLLLIALWQLIVVDARLATVAQDAGGRRADAQHLQVLRLRLQHILGHLPGRLVITVVVEAVGLGHLLGDGGGAVRLLRRRLRL